MARATVTYLRVTEAAVVANCHRETIAEALRGKELHGAQPRKGATWKVRQDCLEAWVEKRPCPHKAEPGLVQAA